MKKLRALSQRVLVIGVTARDPNGTKLAFEILAENGQPESMEVARSALVNTMQEEGFTHLSEPYTRTMTLEELAQRQETQGAACELFPYH